MEDFHADRKATEEKGNEARGSLKINSKCIHYFIKFTAVSADVRVRTIKTDFLLSRDDGQ